MNSMARKIYREMISPSGLLERTGDALPKHVSWDDAGRFGLASYEAGMFEVLRGIAEEDLDCGVGEIPSTPEMDKWGKVAVQKASELSGELDETSCNLFAEFECAQQDASSAEANEYFIQGFLRGYRYLKNQMEFRGGSL